MTEKNHMPKKLTIGVMGGVGSFSEQAANYYCLQKRSKDYKIEYLINAENVLKSLKNKKIDLAVFPIENSNGGIVYEAVYAMAKYNFKIEKMFEIDISHCLMKRKDVAIGEIKKISSHIQALRQCRMYLRRKWPTADLVEYKDTAEAARDLNSGKIDKHTAIIANKVCSIMYDLDIIEEGIQDLKFNFTTFVVAKN